MPKEKEKKNTASASGGGVCIQACLMIMCVDIYIYMYIYITNEQVPYTPGNGNWVVIASTLFLKSDTRPFKGKLSDATKFLKS